MATLEDEIKDLKEKNNELAQKVQYWKMTAAQKDDEKLALMKEINDLRLKLSRLRNNGGLQAQKLDTALQAASEKAISHLVKASAEIAKSMEIAKAYMRERQELDDQSPRWSAIGGTPTADKSDRIHRVPPMMIGGQPIQPVVALSRTLLNTSDIRSESNSTQNRSLTERAVPMHMLQDVYIPLTRIDADLHTNNVETDPDPPAPENTRQEVPEDEIVDEFELSSDGHISPISEEAEYEAYIRGQTPPRPPPANEYKLGLVLTPYLEIEKRRFARGQAEGSRQSDPPREEQRDPLEGPSWLLDTTPTNTKEQKPKSRVNLEPDSTTEPETPGQNPAPTTEPEPVVEFSPTVRRRKRTSSPPPLATPRQTHYSPRPNDNRNSTGRVLKVMVAKMRISEKIGDGCGEGSSSSPPKRARSPRSLNNFDAPSPNGATDSRVIVSVINSIRSESVDNPRGEQAASQEEQPRRRHSPDDTRQSRNTEQGRRRGTSQDRDSSNPRGRGTSGACSEEYRDSDSSGGAGDHAEGRSRRAKKHVTYKEKPLNRKLRR